MSHIIFTRTERARLAADPIFQSQALNRAMEDDVAAHNEIARRVRFLRDCPICCEFHGSKVCPSDPRDISEVSL